MRPRVALAVLLALLAGCTAPQTGQPGPFAGGTPAYAPDDPCRGVPAQICPR